jgi:membrane-bound metal-dependent hydrolase YbcI (DUF457 family)
MTHQTEGEGDRVTLSQMLIFGHAGITLGAALLGNTALGKGSPKAEPSQNALSGGRASWFTSLMNHVDVRLLLVGSLFPDIIDKPVGQFFFRDIFSNGRIFSHTLLFVLFITLFAIYLYRSREKTWLLVLSFGTFTHLICDQMWLTPQTLLWPLYGFAFERLDLTFWTQNIFYALFSAPGVYIPELLGLMILGWFGLTLVRRRKLGRFIKSGQVMY